MTTTTGMNSAARILVGDTGFGQRLEHQFRDRLMSFEVPVDPVGVAPAADNVFADSGFQVDQRDVVLLSPMGDSRDRAGPAVMGLVRRSRRCAPTAAMPRSGCRVD